MGTHGNSNTIINADGIHEEDQNWRNNQQILQLGEYLELSFHISSISCWSWSMVLDLYGARV